MLIIRCCVISQPLGREAGAGSAEGSTPAGRLTKIEGDLVFGNVDIRVRVRKLTAPPRAVLIALLHLNKLHC